MTIQTTPINRTGSTLKMAKITLVLVVCLIAICIEFQEISACLHDLHEPAPCEKDSSCKTDAECNGDISYCLGISESWPYTGKCCFRGSKG